MIQLLVISVALVLGAWVMWEGNKDYKYTATLQCKRCRSQYKRTGTSKGHAKTRVLMLHEAHCASKVFRVDVEEQK